MVHYFCSSCRPSSLALLDKLPTQMYTLLIQDVSVICLALWIYKAMTDTNLSAVLYGKGDLRLEESPVRDPGHGEVKLQMHFCGICGSDLMMWSTGACGRSICDGPAVLGHEGSGVVLEVGEGVGHLKVGDRVTVEPAIPCRRCLYCMAGRYNLCPNRKMSGLPGPNGANGCLRRFHTHSADFVFRLPENVSLEEGALMEPLSVAVHACDRANIAFGNKILVCGAGPIGLLCMMTAKAYGATKVCITDVSELRLEQAKKHGADYTVLIQDEDSLQVASKVGEMLGEQPVISMECSGSPKSVPVAVYSTRPGGRVVIVGISSQTMIPTPICNAGIREVDIIGSICYANCFPRALELVSSGRVCVKDLISHQVNLENVHEAMKIVRERMGMKMVAFASSLERACEASSSAESSAIIWRKNKLKKCYLGSKTLGRVITLKRVVCICGVPQMYNTSSIDLRYRKSSTIQVL